MKFARSGQPTFAYGWPGVLAGEPASGSASRRHRASASIRGSIQTCLGVIVGDDPPFTNTFGTGMFLSLSERDRGHTSERVAACAPSLVMLALTSR